MTMGKVVSCECTGAVAVIELQRPTAANGMNQQLLDELCQAAAACAGNAAARAVVLTASGRFFSAGGDVRAMAEFGADRDSKTRRLADTLHTAMRTFARMDKPLIVAVNGVAAGGGLGLAVVGDIVLASASASFRMGYGSIGLSPDGGSTYLLPRLVGMRRAQQLAYTKRTLTAAEALAWGLVTDVVPDAELRTTAIGLASSLAAGARGAFGATKRLLSATWGAGFSDHLDAEADAIGECAGTADGEEGIRAFLEKRTPRFAS